MKNKIIKSIIIILIVVELLVLLGIGLAITIPSANRIKDYQEAEKGFAIIDQDNFFALQNNYLPDKMAENFDIPKVNEACHKMINDLNPYIMYSYLPDIIDDIQVQCRVANEHFFDLYNMSLYDGRMFDTTDFTAYKDAIIPVVVGYNLKDIYQLGKKYSFHHGDEDKYFQGEIVGILQKNSNYSSLQDINVLLDNSYIIPLSDCFIDEFFGMSDYDLSVSSMIIEDNGSELQDIIDNINSINFWKLDIVSIRDALNDYRINEIDRINNYFTFSIIAEVIIIAMLAFEIILFIKFRKPKST